MISSSQRRREDVYSGFWATFVADYWEKRPVHFTREVVPIVDSDHLFEIVRRTFIRLRSAEPDFQPDIRFSASDQEPRPREVRTAAQIPEIAPTDSDNSFQEWDRRLKGVEYYFLQLSQLQTLDAILWGRLRAFVTGLYRQVGIPAYRAWCDVYIGRYSSTPFGVHLDGASNFTFGIEGCKTLYLWEPSFYHHVIEREGPKTDYRKYLGEAIALTVRPGELIYWPGRFWHIAEPRGFSVTMNFAYYGQYEPVGLLQRAARMAVDSSHLNLAKSKVTIARESAFHQFEGVDLDILAGGLQVPDSIVQTEARVKDALDNKVQRLWLEKITGLGFDEVLPLRNTELPEPISRVRCDARIAKLSHSGRLIVSANGHSAEVPALDEVVKLIDRLNSGNRISVGMLVAKSGIDSTLLRRLLGLLYAWHACEAD